MVEGESIYPRKVDQQDEKIRKLETRYITLEREQEIIRKRLAALEGPQASIPPPPEKKKPGPKPKEKP
jgi:hypothetical protein